MRYLLLLFIVLFSGCDDTPSSVTAFRVQSVTAGNCEYSARSMVNGELYNSAIVTGCGVTVGDIVYLNVPVDQYRSPYVRTKVVVQRTTRTVVPSWYIAFIIICIPLLPVVVYLGSKALMLQLETQKETKRSEQNRLDKYAKDSGIIS